MIRIAGPLAVLALAAPAFAQSVLFTAAGDSANDSFGQSVDVIADVDGDGCDDAIVGAWRDDPAGKADAGTVRVVSGRTGLTLFTIPGDLAADHMGWGSSGAGDADGDGFGDVLAAADEADVAGVANEGSAKIVSGRTGQVLWLLTGDNSADLFGWSSAYAGDADGDGRGDSAVGALNDDAPGLANCGSLSVFSGATGQRLFRAFGGAAGDTLGDSVGGAGDVDGDGKDDTIGGAPAADPNGTSSGAAIVYGGATGAVLWTLKGDSAGDGFGGSVSGAGDVDLDGFADLVVGAAGDDNTGSGAGSVRVVSGATGLTLVQFDGDAAGDQLGASVRGAGDVDGDGHADVVAGAPGDDDHGASCGAVRVWSGRTGAVLATFFGDAAGDQLGASVGAGGDLDGDRFDDVISGAIGDDDGGSGSGTARAFGLIPAGVHPFGAGTPGCSGAEKLNANRVPNVGASDFALIGSFMPPSTVGFLLIADAANVAGTPGLGTGAVLHIALPPASTFVLLGNSFVDPKGSMIAPVPLPAIPSIAGFSATFQDLALWPSACPGLPATKISSSPGVTITIQP